MKASGDWFRVYTYRDIHGVWIAAKGSGEMIGYGETKIDALDKASETCCIGQDGDEDTDEVNEFIGAYWDEIKEGNQ